MGGAAFAQYRSGLNLTLCAEGEVEEIRGRSFAKVAGSFEKFKPAFADRAPAQCGVTRGLPWLAYCAPPIA
jgi:hypothetical protein